ncbi:MAG: hypothetical protein JXA69_15815 [Phycisphaerae bacterium]|nr:hypothetical protein [Phycisphaerae bacterium]
MTSTWPERRALVVSLVGLVLQIMLAVVLLVVALWNGSEANRAAALLATCGLPIWVLLALIYKQRQLVREETLETEQLKREREASGAGAALFAGDEERLLVARRRLQWIYRWLVPLFTILTIGLLVLLSLKYWSWSFGRSVYDKGWTIPENASVSFAFVVGVAFVAFLMSRYATGMAKQPEWRLLRAGAAYLMGTTLACVAVAVMLGLVQFQAVVPERVLAYVLRILLLVLAAEFLLNFVLDFYRPRQPGDEPRPAFDSRLFGLFCEPGGIAHSIAEALNYQFGFEVSSTWFYKLMQRAITPVIGFGILTLFAMSCFVIVDTGEMVVIERFGRPLQSAAVNEADDATSRTARFDALGPGLRLKLPWPIDIAHRYPAERILDVTIGVTTATLEERATKLKEPLVWTQEHEWMPHVNVIVATDEGSQTPPASETTATAPVQSSRSVAVNLLRVSMPIHYRIKDLQAWRTTFVEPEKIFEDVAYRQLTKYSAGVDVDQVMGADRTMVANDLRKLIQDEVDALGLGVEIVLLGMQSVHPPKEVAKEFEAVVGAESKKRAAIRTAQSERNKLLSEVCGDVARSQQMVEAISKFGGPGVRPAESAQARELIDDLLNGNPAKGVRPITGKAAKAIAEARAEMWQRINSTRADAKTFELEIAVFRSAPEVYRWRKYLQVLSEGLTGVRKYLVAADVDPIYQLQLMDPSVADIEMALQGTE